MHRSLQQGWSETSIANLSGGAEPASCTSMFSSSHTANCAAPGLCIAGVKEIDNAARKTDRAIASAERDMGLTRATIQAWGRATVFAAALALPSGAAGQHLTQDNVAALKTWTYTLAMQAAGYADSLVTMYALRHNDAVGPQAKTKPNHVWRMENISTPELSKEAGYVTPNVNVVYGFGFLDLRQEPIIIKAPDSHGLYYMVEICDMWTNAFAYIGGKATGYNGGTFALVGPGWKGELPAGVNRIDSPTPWVLIQPRVHIYIDGMNLAAAKTVLDGIVPAGLAQFTGKAPRPGAAALVARSVRPLRYRAQPTA
jgi:hypothetical protein